MNRTKLCRKKKGERIFLGMLGVACLAVGAQQGRAAEVSESQPVEQDGSAIIEFNPLFIHGTTVDLSRYAEGNPVAPGTYPVTVLVNNQPRGKHTVRFTSQEGTANARACFTLAELKAIGIKPDASADGVTVKNAQDNPAKCVRVEDIIAGSSVNYNSGDFELSVFVPQINLIYFPRGYIDPASWDAGVPVGFLDYNANLYTLYNGSKGNSTDYNTNFGLLVGFNVGEWRLRKRLNTSWSNRNGMHTQNLYGYAQTDIIPLKSRLTLGDSNTQGELFDSFSLRGAQLQSDKRMLPEGIRNYVPGS